MPDNDTIRVQTSDGQTGTIPRSSLAAAQKAGWKVIDGQSTFEKLTAPDNPLDPVTGQPSAGVLSRTAQSAGAGAMGLLPGIWHGLTDPATAEEKENFKGHRIIPGELPLERLTGAEAIVNAIKAYANPKTRPTLQGAMSVLPEAIGGGMGAVAMGEGLGKTVPKATELAGKVVEQPAKSTLRGVFGAGKRAVERVTKEETEKQTGVQEKALAKRESVKGKYAEAIAKQAEKAKEASAKESAAKTKQQALATKQGPVYQRMNEMADEAQQHISKVEAEVGKQESAKWESFKEKMDNPTVKTGSVVNAIEEASAGLAGESVPIFKAVLNEIAEEDPMSQASVFKSKGAVDFKELMNKAAPAVRDRLIRDLEAQGFTEESGFSSRAVDLPLDNARQLYTRISRVLNSRELPRPVARAIGMVQESLDNNIAESITKKGGPEALREYRKLQQDYRQYRQTFSDRDSPLRRITEAKDPHTKLGPITGETGQRAVDYLGRYRNLGAQPEVLGKIRAMNKALKELPSAGGKTPGTVDRPALPKVPETNIPSAEEIRKGLLQKAGQGGTGIPSTWEIIFPRALLKRYLIKNMLLQNPGFIDWLAKDKSSTPRP